MQTAEQPFGAYNNLDPTRRYGVTLTEKIRMNKALDLNGQFNYVDARFASGMYSGNIIPAVPAVTGNIGLDYAWTDHWKTQYSWFYTGTSYAADDVENAGPRLPGYWVNNIAIQYFLKYVDMSFEVINLFNQSYAAFASYDSFTQTNTYYPAPGRNYLLTVKFSL